MTEDELNQFGLDYFKAKCEGRDVEWRARYGDGPWPPWHDVEPPSFSQKTCYELRYPLPRAVNPAREIPLAMTATPEIGTEYWTPRKNLNGQMTAYIWLGEEINRKHLKEWECYATEQAAYEVWEASRAHNFTEGES